MEQKLSEILVKITARSKRLIKNDVEIENLLLEANRLGINICMEGVALQLSLKRIGRRRGHQHKIALEKPDDTDGLDLSTSDHRFLKKMKIEPNNKE